MLNVTKFRWVQKRVYINKVFCCVGLFPRKTVIYLFFSAGGGGSSARHVCPAGALSCLPAFLNLVKLSLGFDCLVTCLSLFRFDFQNDDTPCASRCLCAHIWPIISGNLPSACCQNNTHHGLSHTHAAAPHTWGVCGVCVCESSAVS